MWFDQNLGSRLVNFFNYRGGGVLKRSGSNYKTPITVNQVYPFSEEDIKQINYAYCSGKGRNFCFCKFFKPNSDVIRRSVLIFNINKNIFSIIFIIRI